MTASPPSEPLRRDRRPWSVAVVCGALALARYVASGARDITWAVVALVGLGRAHRHANRLRNACARGVAFPIAYAIAYISRDSEVNLLPVVYALALLLCVGLAAVADAIPSRRPRLAGAPGVLQPAASVWRYRR